MSSHARETQAMEELGVKYAASRRENEFNPRLPCAAQGRIGPGKGASLSLCTSILSLDC